MDPELCRTVCRLVAGIIVSDDDVDVKENQFIDRMLDRFGIESGTRDVIFPIIDLDEAVAAMTELPPDVKEEAMQLLLEAACADGKVVDEERQYLHAIAGPLGITPEQTDQMIAVRLSFS